MRKQINIGAHGAGVAVEVGAVPLGVHVGGVVDEQAVAVVDVDFEGEDVEGSGVGEDVVGGFKFVELKYALEEALKKTIDLVTTGSIEGSLLEGEDLEEVLVYSAE